MFTCQLHSVIPTVYYKLSFGLCSWHTCSLCWRRGCHCGCMGWVLNQTASFPSSVQCCQLEACANFFFSAKHARFVFNPFTCKTVNKSLFKKRYGKKLNLYQNGQKCQTCVCVAGCFGCRICQLAILVFTPPSSWHKMTELFPLPFGGRTIKDKEGEN